MSEFAGRERAIIGAAVSAGAALDAAKLQTLSTYRGSVEQAWLEVSAYLEKKDIAPEVLSAAAAVKQTFFGSFEGTRQAVYAAGIAGTPYPVDTGKWIAEATTAIDTLLALARSTGDTAGELTNTAAAAARLSMITNGVALAVGLALALVAFWIVVVRVLRPMAHITQAMSGLARGDLSVTIPFTAARNEVGEMARAVEVFKENGIKVAAMNEEEKDRGQRAIEKAQIDRRFQKAFAVVVEACLAGDFSSRLTPAFDAELNRFCTEFNTVLDTVDAGLGEAGEVLAALAQADLTHRMAGDYQGAFARLKDDTNRVAEKLTEVITQLRGTSRALKTATSEILEGANDLSERTTKQAATIEETSAAMEQLAATVADNARRADEASVKTSAVSKSAVDSGAVMAKANEAMERISASSSNISNVIGLIDDIAFQTNLLALNASVEAARAGEAGKGFAVVAIEVRRLAQSAAEASQQVKALIEQSTGEVRGGSQLVSEAAVYLASMLEAIQENSALMQGIAQASREQAGAIAEITTAVRLMDEMTQHNAALVEETNAAIEQTESQALELDNIVEIFSIDASSHGASRTTPHPHLRAVDGGGAG